MSFKMVTMICADCGYNGDAQHWIVERVFALLGQQRRLNADYEHLPQTSEAFIHTAMIDFIQK
jgi:putative transposase